MTEDQKAAYVIGGAVTLLGGLLAMHWENQRCLLARRPIKYGEKEFSDAVDAAGVHHNAVLDLYYRR